MSEPAGALDGLLVLDATQMLAGPLAATRLGDLGADVIKIEPPRSGEFNRTHGFEDIRVHGEMTTFTAVNRNKRSLAIDLKNPESRRDRRGPRARCRCLPAELPARHRRPAGRRLRPAQRDQPPARVLLDLGLRLVRALP